MAAPPLDDARWVYVEDDRLPCTVVYEIVHAQVEVQGEVHTL